MNEVEQYLFDLQGYLIVEDVLTQDEVAKLNRLVNVRNLSEPGLESNKARFGDQPPPEVELTPRQRLLFEPPYFYPRASLFEDG